MSGRCVRFAVIHLGRYAAYRLHVCFRRGLFPWLVAILYFCVAFKKKKSIRDFFNGVTIRYCSGEVRIVLKSAGPCTRLESLKCIWCHETCSLLSVLFVEYECVSLTRCPGSTLVQCILLQLN